MGMLDCLWQKFVRCARKCVLLGSLRFICVKWQLTIIAITYIVIIGLANLSM